MRISKLICLAAVVLFMASCKKDGVTNATSKNAIFTSKNTEFQNLTELPKYRDSLSYAIGFYLGDRFKSQDLELNPMRMTHGYVDAMEGIAGLTRKDVDAYLKKVGNVQRYRVKVKSKDFVFPLSIDSTSYAIGVDMGLQQKGTNYEMHPNAFHQGIKEAYAGNKELMNEKDRKRFMGRFFKGMKSVLKNRKKENVDNSQDAVAEKDFFAKNRKEKGIATLPSGVQYKILNTGEGSNVTFVDRVFIKFEGRLLDGTVVHTSPGTLPQKVLVSEAMQGWVDGLQLMNKGAKFRFFIPSALAFGSEGKGDVPPNAPLIYDIELMDILKK